MLRRLFSFRRTPLAPPPPSPDGRPQVGELVWPAPAPPEPIRAGWLGRGRGWWIARMIAGFIALLFVLAAYLLITAPLSKSLQPIAPPQITLLASNGTPIARNGAVVETPVRIKALPPHVVQAFLAIEDRRFYSHWGLDPRGMVRAIWGNITSSRTQGGSTITQQLAKFTFLTPERSLTRKAREALIAVWLELWLTKDEILERYLSNAYFGDNTYGLRAASLHYFRRQPEKLTLGQAAMLAGLVQAPSRLAPSRNPEPARKRMRLVLGAMADAGYITPAHAAAVPDPVVDVRQRNTLPTGTYFADWALPEARKLSDVGYARQTLTTTLDARLQAIARDATAQVGRGATQVALVAMRPNGEVVAMIGGRDYAASPFNRATQARRQPGSTFKLFVYLAALREGWRPTDTIANTPIDSGAYRPQNVGGAYSRQITLADAFAQSSNVVAVRLLGRIGHKPVIDTARDLGITAPLADGDPSMALGTSTMTLLQLTAAYAGVAANSFPVEPRAFKAEEPGWLDWLTNRKGSLSAETRRQMETMLAQVVSQGTGRAAALSRPVYGKTGTSQDARDALFVGYSGGLVVGVWVGRDDNQPLAGISGGGLPARIWRSFMARALNIAPAPRPSANPRGPVVPQDVPDSAEIPIGDGAAVKIGPDGAVVTTQIGGLPVGVRVDGNGVSVEPVSADQARQQADQAAARAREAELRAEAQAREALRQAEARLRQQGQ